MTNLVQLGDGMWSCEQQLRFFGVPVGARMGVMRLGSGGLLVYSPVRATPEVLEEVKALGEVKHLVAPNRWHHLFIKDWMAAHPNARVHGAPGLEKKRPDVTFHSKLSDAAEPDWSPSVTHVALRGWPIFSETVFVHHPSKTLVCADFIHNIGEDKTLLTKAFYASVGSYGGFKTGLVERVTMRDRAAAKASVERVLELEFDRVMMGHGTVLEGGGRDALRKAYSWVLT